MASLLFQHKELLKHGPHPQFPIQEEELDQHNKEKKVGTTSIKMEPAGVQF